jgi:hypothetical protein
MSIFGTPVFKVGTASGGSSTATPAFTTAAGDLIVVAVGWSADGGASTVTSVTDTAGNTYSPVTASPQANLGAREQFWYCLAASANAANVITAHFSQSQTFTTIAAWDVPISGGTAAFDVQAGGNDGGHNNITSFATGSFTTTGTDEIVFAAMVNDFGTVTYSAGSGYTLDSGSYTSAEPVSGAEHRTFSSTQTGITATMTGGSPADGAITAAAFKASAGGGGGGTAKPVVCVMQ